MLTSAMACSGAMYWGVPTATDVVSQSPAEALTALYTEVGDRGVAAREHHVGN
jgi:hypothetical protein